MWQWLHKLADESHTSEATAAKWHVGHAVTYGVLILFYVGSIGWHLAAAARHRETARKLKDLPHGQMDDPGETGC